MKYLRTRTGFIPPAPARIAFFPTRASPPIEKYDLLRKAAKDYPPIVERRLEWIIFYETVGKGNAKRTAGLLRSLP